MKSVLFISQFLILTSHAPFRQVVVEGTGKGWYDDIKDFHYYGGNGGGGGGLWSLKDFSNLKWHKHLSQNQVLQWVFEICNFINRDRF